jgi:hypothetical protein
MSRLSKEREAEIRDANRRFNGSMEWDLLAELDAVRAELHMAQPLYSRRQLEERLAAAEKERDALWKAVKAYSPSLAAELREVIEAAEKESS